MKYSLDILQDYIDKGLVVKQDHPSLPLSIYNYSRTCQYEGKWDHVTMTCRGLILDNKGNVVAKGFPKFFNMEELDSIPNEPFTVTAIDQAFGSQDAATIQYQIYSNPGSYNNANSYNAYVIPYSYLPKIEAELEQNKFSNKEYITDDQVQIISNINNDPITNLIKTKNSKNVSIGSTITGKSSQSRGKVIEVDKFNFSFGVDSSVSEILGGFELSTAILELKKLTETAKKVFEY